MSKKCQKIGVVMTTTPATYVAPRCSSHSTAIDMSKVQPTPPITTYATSICYNVCSEYAISIYIAILYLYLYFILYYSK